MHFKRISRDYGKGNPARAVFFEPANQPANVSRKACFGYLRVNQKVGISYG